MRKNKGFKLEQKLFTLRKFSKLGKERGREHGRQRLPLFTPDVLQTNHSYH